MDLLLTFNSIEMEITTAYLLLLDQFYFDMSQHLVM